MDKFLCIVPSVFREPQKRRIVIEVHTLEVREGFLEGFLTLQFFLLEMISKRLFSRKMQFSLLSILGLEVGESARKFLSEREAPSYTETMNCCNELSVPFCVDESTDYKYRQRSVFHYLVILYNSTIQAAFSLTLHSRFTFILEE